MKLTPILFILLLLIVICFSNGTSNFETLTSRDIYETEPKKNKTEFRHDCCPSTYSTSHGCACMTIEDVYYLASRAGNNDNG